jgi:hypothetical protein
VWGQAEVKKAESKPARLLAAHPKQQVSAGIGKRGDHPQKNGLASQLWTKNAVA